MKKRLLILAIAVSLPFIINAQKVELTPYGGYVFGGTMNGDYGEVHFNDAAQWGVMLSIAVNKAFDFDLMYNRQVTDAEIYYFDPYYSISYDGSVPLSINYMHVGFTKNFRVNPKVSPFLGFNLGTALFSPEEYSDAWYFSMGFNAGAKIYFGKTIGMKIQAQGLMPIQGAGGAVYMGSGGVSGGLGLYSTLFQFGFTGGLILRLG